MTGLLGVGTGVRTEMLIIEFTCFVETSYLKSMSHAWDTFAILMCEEDHSDLTRGANKNNIARHIIIQKHALVFLRDKMECMHRPHH